MDVWFCNQGFRNQRHEERKRHAGALSQHSRGLMAKGAREISSFPLTVLIMDVPIPLFLRVFMVFSYSIPENIPAAKSPKNITPSKNRIKYPMCLINIFFDFGKSLIFIITFHIQFLSKAQLTLCQTFQKKSMDHHHCCQRKYMDQHL